MAAVYLAYQQSLDRQVAIKCINLELFNNEEFKKRAIGEAKHQCKLIDKRIVQVYDAFQDPIYGNLIIMEYVRGESLDKIISTRTKIPEKEALKIFKEVLIAISLAHKQNVIHRDIKPGNILIDANGDPNSTTTTTLEDLAEKYFESGLAYYYKGYNDKAIQDYDKAISLNAELHGLYQQQGYMYEKKGNFGKAIQDYKKACDIGNKDACSSLKEMTK